MRVKQCKRNEGYGDYRNLTWRASSQSVLPLLQGSFLIFLKKIPIEFPDSPLSTSFVHLFPFRSTAIKTLHPLSIFSSQKNPTPLPPSCFFSSYHPKPASSKHPAPFLVISLSGSLLKLPFSRCSPLRLFLPNPKTPD